MYIIPHFSNKTYSYVVNFLSPYSKIFHNSSFEIFVFLITGIIVFERVQSVRFIYNYFITQFTPTSLNSIYYFFAYSPWKIESLIETTIQIVVKFILKAYENNHIFLIIDDTLQAKFGTHFDSYMKHFDHCKRNNSSYLKGHSFVCLSISIPVKIIDNKPMYITIPVGFRLYTGEKSKLKISSTLVESAMKYLSQYNVVLLCDSWYSKGEVLSTVESFKNLELFGAVRCDTALFKVPERTGKKGRPRRYGERLSPKDLNFEKQGDYYVAKSQVKTRIMKEAIEIVVTVKDISNFSSIRLFLNTGSLPFSMEESQRNESTKNPYSVRWNIEIIFYEFKKYWSFGNYMVRRNKAIETYVGLLCVAFTTVSLMPFFYEEMEPLQFKSPQEIKVYLADEIRKEIILSSFVETLESTKIYSNVLPYLQTFIQRKRFF
jgi:hypothetical protein